MTLSSTVASDKELRIGENTPGGQGLALFCSKEDSVVVPHLQVAASMTQ